MGIFNRNRYYSLNNFLNYYCKDNFYLNDKLDLDEIACSNLPNETFEAIK